jgi:spore cortex biosynthesis protein YabQ
MHEEILLFLSAAAFGGILLFCYDLLIVLRRVFPHSPWMTSAEDLVYWIAAGLTCFLAVYRENQGILRMFLLPGLLLGAALYHKTLEPLILHGLTGFLRMLTFFVKKIINRLLFPVKRGNIYVYKFLNLAKRGFTKPIFMIKRGRPGEKNRRIIQNKENRE